MAEAVHLVTGAGSEAAVRRVVDGGAGWLHPWTYPRAAKADPDAFAPGICVFTDLDRLDDDAAFIARQVHDRLEARGDVRCINHPTRTLRRFELLRLLRNLGRNPVDVRRVEDRRAPARWPVIVRTESDPLRLRPALLRSAGELAAELERLEGLDGYRPDLLIVEVPGAGASLEPVTRVLRIGDTLVPAHGPPASPAELASLRAVFDLARIGFGSATLCRLDGTAAIVDTGTEASMVVEPATQAAVLAGLAAIRNG